MVCLSDLDSAPFHLWLGSLHAVLDDPDRPTNLVVFATLGVAGSDSSHHPCENAIRDRLVVVHPRADLHNIPKATLRPSNSASSFAWSFPELESLPHNDVLAVATNGKSYSPVRRAIRFRLAAELTKAERRQVWATAWATYLRTGQNGDLPASLAQGAIDTPSINYRN
jgi:hypothetical protein